MKSPKFILRSSDRSHTIKIDLQKIKEVCYGNHISTIIACISEKYSVRRGIGEPQVVPQPGATSCNSTSLSMTRRVSAI